MNTVSFQNKGLIDPVAITTFGISAKDNDNPIGFFGTGLKYAIAILLREKCNITIFRGHEEFVFDTEEVEVRGQTFDIVRMNGANMGLTLDVGKTWEMWQAFRELYCNTLDEMGETVGNTVPLQDNHTTIIVSGAAFYEEYVRRDRIVLLGKPDFVAGGVEIHERPNGGIYYQGVKVGQFEKPSSMTYNILSKIKLTEDRTIADIGEVNRVIRQALFHSSDKELIEKFMRAPAGSYEAWVDLDWYETPGEVFLDVLQDLPFQQLENGTLLVLHRKYREKAKLPEGVETLTGVEKEQLQRAIDFSTLLDFPVDKYAIHITDDLNDNVLGMVLSDEIYVARRTFMMGTKMVAATLIEEYLHIEKGFADCERPMQNFLFEKLVSLGEELTGEAL